MQLLIDWLPIVLLMTAVSIAGGVLAGMLGVGGGIIFVPALDLVFGFIGVDQDVSMHIAVATSLAIIIPTSVVSSKGHHNRRAVDVNLVKSWAPTILLGAMIGALFAGYVKSSYLSLGYAVMTTMVALNMIFADKQLTATKTISDSSLAFVLPFGLGSVSGMLGIGGGALSVPLMHILLKKPMHLCIGSAATFGVLISVPATLFFILSGWGDIRLPAGSLGFVNVLGFAIMAPTTVLMTPLGVRLAHRIEQRSLRLVFAILLMLIASRMLYKTLFG